MFTQLRSFFMWLSNKIIFPFYWKDLRKRNDHNIFSDKRAYKRTLQGNVGERKGCERRSGSCSQGGVLYTSAIHILQYGRGVADRLGVAYRRHVDVRRSANDWSIATRRFSPRELFVPFSLPWPSRFTYGRNLRASHACARTYANRILGEQPHQTVVHPSRRNPSPYHSLSPFVFAYADLRGWISLYHFQHISKKWRVALRLRNRWVKNISINYI